MSFDPKASNPYAPSTPPAVPKKSNVLVYVLGGIGVLCLVLCLGCAGFMAYGFSWLGTAAAEQIKPALRADPVVQEHIGEISSLSTDWVATSEEVQRAKREGGQRRIVFEIEGSKGKGTIIGAPKDNGNRLNGELRMSTGETYPLSP